MKILDVLYYYYYLFYTKIIPEDEPNATVIFTLGASCSFPMGMLLDCVLSYNCYYSNTYLLFSVSIVFWALFYFLYYRTKLYKKVIQARPKFFGSHRKTIITVFLFFLVTASFMFWGPIVSKNIFDECDCKKELFE